MRYVYLYSISLIEIRNFLLVSFFLFITVLSDTYLIEFFLDILTAGKPKNEEKKTEAYHTVYFARFRDGFSVY